MWHDITGQTLYREHGYKGVAPSRHELARQAYTEKVRQRHETEQRAATFGALARTIQLLLTVARSIAAGRHSGATEAGQPSAGYPAE